MNTYLGRNLSQHLSLLVLLIFFVGCKEPISFDFESPPDDLVIDGFITDNLKRHTIRLSLTSSLIDNVQNQRPVLGGQIFLEDNLGGSIELENLGTGVYLTPEMKAELGRQYKLSVQYQGELYESEFEQLPTATFDPDLSVEVVNCERRDVIQGRRIVNRAGTLINANIKKSDQNVYYQWFLSQCFVSALASDLFGNTSRFCSVLNNLNPPGVFLYKDDYIPGIEGKEIQTELAWKLAPLASFAPEVVEIDQFLISEKAYDYWFNIKESVERQGSIFDPIFSVIYGNVRNVSTNKSSLGFFGVYREAPNWERAVLSASCGG